MPDKGRYGDGADERVFVGMRPPAQGESHRFHARHAIGNSAAGKWFASIFACGDPSMFMVANAKPHPCPEGVSTVGLEN